MTLTVGFKACLYEYSSAGLSADTEKVRPGKVIDLANL
jgi:hypothetical protein